MKNKHFFAINTIANQYLWVEKNNFIPDFSNVIFVEMYDNAIDSETGEEYGWVNYWNEEDCMECICVADGIEKKCYCRDGSECEYSESMTLEEFTKFSENL